MKYRIADRGYVRSAADVARFIAFNLFETSFAQKGSALGAPEADPNDPNRWDLKLAREQIGYKLFLEALAQDDPPACRDRRPGSGVGSATDRARCTGARQK